MKKKNISAEPEGARRRYGRDQRHGGIIRTRPPHSADRRASSEMIIFNLFCCAAGDLVAVNPVVDQTSLGDPTHPPLPTPHTHRVFFFYSFAFPSFCVRNPSFHCRNFNPNQRWFSLPPSNSSKLTKLPFSMRCYSSLSINQNDFS